MLSVKIPKADIDLNAPEFDSEAPEGKIKGSKFKMPSISGPRFLMPDVDFNLKGPKLKGDVDCRFQKCKEILKHKIRN